MSNGGQTKEVVFTKYSDNGSKTVKVIDENQDGIRTERSETEYDSNGNVVRDKVDDDELDDGDYVGSDQQHHDIKEHDKRRLAIMSMSSLWPPPFVREEDDYSNPI